MPGIDVDLQGQKEDSFRPYDDARSSRRRARTPGHIALYNPEQKLLLTGDTLFRESIGRTDLPGGDYSWIMRSILDKLMPLGDDVHFYPGHGQRYSTIGHEALYNPFVTEALGGEVNCRILKERAKWALWDMRSAGPCTGLCRWTVI